MVLWSCHCRCGKGLRLHALVGNITFGISGNHDIQRSKKGGRTIWVVNIVLWANCSFHFVLLVSGAPQNQVTKALAIVVVTCMEKSQTKLVYLSILNLTTNCWPPKHKMYQEPLCILGHWEFHSYSIIHHWFGILHAFTQWFVIEGTWVTM